ncbi:MAG: AAA family ATPase [Paludibacteraceae bacterium]|nr:AAA family ATPase [Paludibacteraceae bacterium]
MIEKIHMQGIATYDATGVDIDTNKKINYIFGYNGSGKSTIARFLYNLTLTGEEKSPDYDRCNQSGYDSTTQTILVYNEDFRQKNFIVKDEQKGIFSLNQTNAEVDKQIDAANEERRELVNSLLRVKGIGAKIISQQEVWQKKAEENVFAQRQTFISNRQASLPYGGSKKNFYQAIRELLPQAGSAKPLPTLMAEYHRVFENMIQQIPYTIDIQAIQQLVDSETGISAQLNEVIVGNNDVDIAALIEQLHISSWVDEGREYMAQSGNKCPFCQHEFDNKAELQSKFELFFDATYAVKLEEIREKSEAYRQGLDEQIEVLKKIVAIFNPQNAISSLITDLTQFKDRFEETIREKQSRPNERKSIGSLSQFVNRFSEIKTQIDNNNQDYRDLASLKSQWIQDAQIYIAANSKSIIEKQDRINEKCAMMADANNVRQISLQSRVDYLTQRISALRKLTVNTTEAVDNIRKILKRSGFDGFEIKEKATPSSAVPTYYLKRNGATSASNVYSTLSEGEKTFISFLYFHQLCLGTDDLTIGASRKKIIVIDDPVSSLDSKVLFVITTLIHQLAKYKYEKGHPNAEKQEFANPTIEQLFILTHNYYFYKEVSFSRRPINTSVKHHVLEKINNVTNVTSSENCTIKNDYTMMWDNLKKCKASASLDKSQNVMIANTMRRVIDTYMEFTGCKRGEATTATWTALNSYTDGSPEQIVASAFISFVNDESHAVTVFDDMYYTSLINQEPLVIFTVFKSLFENIGKEHYEMMMNETY